MILRQIKALITLALAMVQKIIFLPKQKISAEPWLAHLRTESLMVTPKTTWQHAQTAGRCISCGLCDAFATNELQPNKTIALLGRRPQDALLVIKQAKLLRQLASRIASICPAQVGVYELTQLVIEHAKKLEKKQRAEYL